MLKVENIVKTFAKGTPNEHLALNHLNLEVADGDFVTVLGSNGAGKSTLLKCISSVMKPTGGTIEFLGKPVSQKPYEVVEMFP